MPDRKPRVWNAGDPPSVVSPDTGNDSGELRADLAELINDSRDGADLYRWNFLDAADAILAAGWRPPLPLSPADTVRSIAGMFSATGRQPDAEWLADTGDAIEQGAVWPKLEPLPDSETEASGVSLIAAERRRQVDEEGWTNDHDSEHRNGAMAKAAACYALPPKDRDVRSYEDIPLGGSTDRGNARYFMPSRWPWAAHFWKPCPDDRVRELVKAGALIAAEIDRLQADRPEVTA